MSKESVKVSQVELTVMLAVHCFSMFAEQFFNSSASAKNIIVFNKIKYLTSNYLLMIHLLDFHYM